MARACRQVELMVRVPPQRGSLAGVLAEVARQGCDVLAYCAYFDGADCIVLLVPDNPLAAQRAVTAAGLPCKANPVVLVRETDSVGAVARLGRQLQQAGIEILYSYASSTGESEFRAVFKTTDDEQALRLLDPPHRQQNVA